jgi:hypothetical protein
MFLSKRGGAYHLEIVLPDDPPGSVSNHKNSSSYDAESSCRVPV